MDLEHMPGGYHETREALDAMHNYRALEPVINLPEPFAVEEPIALIRPVVETRLFPPLAMLLKGCEADWVEDVWAGRRHVHRERS